MKKIQVTSFPVFGPGFRPGLFRCLVLGLLLVVIAGVPTASAQEPFALGDPLQVNTYTTGGQSFPRVATFDDGGFVVVWQSDGSTGDDQDETSVQARRFAADGTPLAGEMQVNVATTAQQSSPAVAVSGDQILVVWAGPDGGATGGLGLDFGVQGRLFTTAGAAAGNEFQINTYTNFYQWRPSVAALGDGGDFIVAWDSFGSETVSNNWEVQAQRVAADGTLLGAPLAINSYTTGSQLDSRVLAMPTGGFLAAWSGPAPLDGIDGDIRARCYAESGAPLTVEFQVNDQTTGEQSQPALSVDEVSGDFVVVWESATSAGDGDGGIEARRFDSNAQPLGSEFMVQTTTALEQGLPAIAHGAEGDFTVVWRSREDVPGFEWSLRGQRFTASGSPLGGEFVVVPGPDEGDLLSDLARNTAGELVMVWDASNGNGNGNGNDTDGTASFAQRFSLPLFADGFESGDTTAWSATEP